MRRSNASAATIAASTFKNIPLLRSWHPWRELHELLGGREAELLDRQPRAVVERVERVGARVQHRGELLVVRDRDRAMHALGAEALLDRGALGGPQRRLVEHQRRAVVAQV